MLTRRKFLLGALALGAGAYWLKPTARSVVHDDYFKQLSAGLKTAGVGSPALILDKARCTHNLATIAAHVGKNKNLRIVTKSLPCPKLLDLTMQTWQTKRQMVFNYPMIVALANSIPDVDILLGKPLDPIELPHFFTRISNAAFDASKQIQWLVDSPQTLSAYINVARTRNQLMRLNIEIDVGLHRGGVADVETLKAMLDQMAVEPLVQFSGLMGYDPHIVKVPDVLSNRKNAQAHAFELYQTFLDICLAHPANQLAREQLTLNTAGSPTYRLHMDERFSNEVSVGSAVVKPSDFDAELLQELQPALYIAAPILKVGKFTLPYGAQTVSNITKLWDVNQSKSVIIHGGEWLAKVASPEGVQPSDLFGHSTNQKVMSAPHEFAYQAGDYVFFRPTQSEMLMLQFGQITIYENGSIVDTWDTFAASA